MRFVRPLFYSLAVALTLAACDSGEPQSPLVGKPAPGFQIPAVSRAVGDVSLEQYRGKVVLLDFWATWCGPCLAIMPHIDELQKKYRDKGLVVIGITTEDPKVVDGWKESTGRTVSYELLADLSAQANRDYGVTNLPTTVLIGRDGKVRHVEVGADPEGGVATLAAQVEAALAEKA
jgi:thiol-disulfide isomerase/thioredoxin